MSNAPALKRLDHIICRVPDIEVFHAHFRDKLGFPEAWPIGRFWPEGRTSGIALGGINLELIQPDKDAPAQAATDTLVFEPTSLEAAERQFSALGVKTRRFDKIEPDPELLALRGFSKEEQQTPQLICRNLLLDSPFPVPMFLCDYSPGLKQRLTDIPSPHGRVLSLHVPWDIAKLSDLGYLGDIELIQSDSMGITLESGFRSI